MVRISVAKDDKKYMLKYYTTIYVYFYNFWDKWSSILADDHKIRLLATL